MRKPRFISLDFETRSTVDLRKTGVYTYAEDPTTDVWCAAYRVGDGPIRIWHHGDPFPPDLDGALRDGAYLRAWNAQFERIIWREVMVRKHGWPALDNDRFVCSMVAAAAAGLPMNLEEAAIVLGLAEQKDMAGSRLMHQMAKPRKIEDDGTIVWWDDRERRERLAAYCAQDVKTEVAAWARLPPCMDKRERRLYLLDQRINDRGVRLDLPLIDSARVLARQATAGLNAELKTLTGGTVPAATKVEDLKTWVRARGVPTRVLDKARVAELLAGDLPGDVRRALEIRAEAAKTSVRKYAKMAEVAGADGKARGLLQFYGAGTGRWAGRQIQPQNFPKGSVKITPAIVEAVRERDLSGLGDHPPMEVLSSLLRGALIPSDGSAFYVADFNAIEARVVAWLAGETRLVNLFASGGKVYETMAARVFGGRVEDVTPEQRQVGKMVVLGCGFQMGPNKFAAQTGVEAALAESAVRAYREANPAIPQLWYGLDDAALACVRRQSTLPVRYRGLSFRLVGDWLAMDLPSGRALWYHRPRIVERLCPWTQRVRDASGNFVELPAYKPAVEIDTRNSVTRKWEAQQMYGGIWTENATQAVARDLMADALLRTEPAGYRTVLTVHDEVIAEHEPGRDIAEFVDLLSVVPTWAAGCPVKAEGWTGDRYRK